MYDDLVAGDGTRNGVGIADVRDERANSRRHFRIRAPAVVERRDVVTVLGERSRQPSPDEAEPARDEDLHASRPRTIATQRTARWPAIRNLPRKTRLRSSCGVTKR